MPRRRGGPLVASLSASCACEPLSEGMLASKRGSQTMPMTNGDAWPSRRSRPFETPRRGSGRCPVHFLILARLSLFAPSLFALSLYPCVFLGGFLPRLTYAPRWRSNGHPQWNINDEFVNESARQRKQLHSFSLHLSYLDHFLLIGRMHETVFLTRIQY